MGSIAGSRNAGLIEINSQPDHVHRYASLPSTIAVADLVNAFKVNSSRWIRQAFPNCRCFRWQAGRIRRIQRERAAPAALVFPTALYPGLTAGPGH
jgi:REP element-mobilizing transposase RayT